MSMSLLALSCMCWISSYFPIASAHTADEWKNRTIYQLLTDRFNSQKGTQGCSDLSNYCGGTFQGVVDQLDYIQTLGFDAIWISPIVQNTPGGYHGYWSMNFFTVSPEFGGEDGLKALVAAAHKRNIWVMVDIVLNHVGSNVDISQISPFNSQDHYHSSCDVTEYTCFTQEVLECKLANLPDLNQSNSWVASQLLKWGSWLVNTFDIDGIRADTVMYINEDFWKSFQQQVGVYIVGEVFSDLSCNVQYQQNAIDATLSYPLYFTMRNVFQQQQSMYNLKNTLDSMEDQMPNTDVLVSFIDNHDNSRFLCFNNEGNVTMAQTNDDALLQRYQSALLFTLFSKGIPCVYYGTEQTFSGCDDPQNREVLWSTGFDTSSAMYKSVQRMTVARKQLQVWKYDQDEKYVTDSFYAFARGHALVLLSNNNNDFSQNIPNVPYNSGDVVCNLLSDNSDCLKVNTDGSLDIQLSGGTAKVYAPQSVALRLGADGRVQK